MNVFLSWSGDLSHAVAELLNEWLPCVIHGVKPWISSHDIDRGAVWFESIQTQLDTSTVGIVCLTQENKGKPWILFEAGALTKGLSKGRVCTFLVDLKPGEVENPLAMFNHTQPTKEEVKALLKTLRGIIAEPAAEPVFEKLFEKMWPDFEEGLAKARASIQSRPEVPARSKDDILLEILENTRAQSNAQAQALKRDTEIAELKKLVMELNEQNTALGARRRQLFSANGVTSDKPIATEMTDKLWTETFERFFAQLHLTTPD